MDSVRISKRLSLHLRHAPEKIGITLESDGWVEVETLLGALKQHGLALSRDRLREVVAGNDKQRFAFDETGTRIRASQGHSVEVELNLPTATPPARLYHGTVERFLEAILREGLRPMRRHDVHLSATIDTAIAVGARRGEPVILGVDAQAMTEAGHEFRVSANGVWLTSAVPPEFLQLLAAPGTPE
ncbi:RNA 2'-phosphotransferase [Amycolatopsis sp.]|jgi:putative RNA 2'-phosphotransferase|uniref:RNA 2'-phosphotransferase n=1 Tax=Amycolatopsis sp. TaxID=37632 RepID=UPI002E0773DB|nr:RNA 2'-phosphotransferase [Amycolatopsis sp.]